VTLNGKVIIPENKAITFGASSGTVALKAGSAVATEISASAANAALSVPENLDSSAKLVLGSDATGGALTIGANKAVTASGNVTFGGAAVFGGAATFSGTAAFGVQTPLTGGGTFGGATFAGVATFTGAAAFTGGEARFDDKVVFGGGVTLATAPATFKKTAFFAAGTGLVMGDATSTVTLDKTNGALAVGEPTSAPDDYSQVLAPSAGSSAPVVLTPMDDTKLTFGGSLSGKTVAQATDASGSGAPHGIKITGKATLISGTTYTVASESGKIGTLELGDSADLALGGELTVGTRPPGYAYDEPEVVLTGAESNAGAILKGVGSLSAGDTKIVGGTAGWQADDTGANTVTITKDRITGSASSVSLTAGGAGASITVAPQKTLTLGENATVKLAGSPGTSGASITLGRSGTLAFTATTSKVLVGAGSGGADIGGITSVTIGGAAVTLGGSFAAADLQVITSDGRKYLVQIGGSNTGSLSAGSAADVVIDSAKPVVGTPPPS
jgi:hypothetical protein